MKEGDLVGVDVTLLGVGEGQGSEPGVGKAVGED